jgi:hypothetical protein
MKETGIFRYKVNLFQYCERYMITFSDPAYGEIVLHAPPLSYLSILMFPFLICRAAMVYISKFFSYLMFWVENIFFIFAFFALEIVLLPLAYIKIWFNIIRNSMGVLRTILNALIWAIIGVIMMIFMLFSDMFNLIKILCYHKGCRTSLKLDE